MKKLLVVLMAAMMVLSVAVVAMAEVAVTGDFRAEFIKDDAGTTDANAMDNLDFFKNDLRLNFNGKVSDTVNAYAQFAYDSSKSNPVILKEYYVTLNQSWAKVMAGNWDYKLLPDRVILKLHNINCVNAGVGGMQWLFDIPVGDAVTVGLWMTPTLADDSLDYDAKLKYAGKKLGAEVHYGYDASADGDYQSFSVSYKATDNVKVFVEGINASDEYKATLASWEDNLATAVGAVFSNIAGSKWTASLEYGLDNAASTSTDEFNAWASQIKYQFTNKVALEIEYYNYVKDATNMDTDEENYICIRPRIQF